ncbi:MAG TPA: hypothetical protein VLD55_09415 [Candidatus Sulfobium mesophilum]|nr:hypothetical protein [Candidatus Sulfobium mesophilum]
MVSPIINSDPSKAVPIGIGAAAIGGETVALQIGIGQFSAPSGYILRTDCAGHRPTGFDDIILDTGSVGLKIFKQPLDVALAPVSVSAGVLAELPSVCRRFGELGFCCNRRRCPWK